MLPRQIIDADLAYWADLNPRPVTYDADDEYCAPCPALMTHDNVPGGGDALVVRVPWKLDEIELMHLAKGGTLWLSCWGGLPMHQLEVQEP